MRWKSRISRLGLLIFVSPRPRLTPFPLSNLAAVFPPARCYAPQDSTHLAYVDWAANQPDTKTLCVAMDSSDDGRWVSTDCAQNASFVCKQVSLARTNFSCACSGAVDSEGLGSICKQWVPDMQPWCYVSSDCPRAVRNVQSNMWFAYCDLPTSTTAAPTTTTTTTTTPTTVIDCGTGSYQKGDSCYKCLTSSDCPAGTALVGSCDKFSGPACRACHSSCSSCSGPNADQCLTCKTGKDASARERGHWACLAAAPL